MHEKLETALLLHQPLRKKYDFYSLMLSPLSPLNMRDMKKSISIFFVPLTGPCMLAEKYIIDNTP